MSVPKYSLIDSTNGFHDDHWSIRIEEGDYKGLMYQYDSVKMIESEEDDGGVILEFNTITVENPNNVNLTNEEEKNILGNILVDIISEHIEHIEHIEQEENENRTSDTEHDPS